MQNRSRLRILLLGAVALLGGASCTELPDDIGVRAHRSIASLTRGASGFPLFPSWRDHPSIKGRPKILVNLSTQQAFFYRGKILIGKTNISSGRREFETPPGKYRVIQKDANHVSSEYGAYVSRRSGRIVQRDVNARKDPCPKGAVFVGASMPYFMRFTGGYGMHAGYVPRYRASHGCIRMPEKMARRFFEAAKVGTRVEVIEPPLMVER
ncbi:MAG TPA: L,D-transpeptidase [Chthoniobacterales bacterium]|nr:L,D-transpeptidase [Chthoniobacterales bacterium]